MKDQMIVIADALESACADWACSFQFHKTIGEHRYPVVLARQGSRLELAAKLPVYVSAEERPLWESKIDDANARLDCGAFSLCDSGSAVCYRVYSPYSREDEVKDDETVKMLLSSCNAALETHGEAMLFKERKKGPIECLFAILGLTNREAKD